MNGEIKEDYVSYELAVLLSEKGFKWEYNPYDPDEYGDGKHSYFERRSNGDKVSLSHFYFDTNQNSQQYIALHVAAPTISLVIKWLRIKYDIYIWIEYTGVPGFIEEYKSMTYNIKSGFQIGGPRMREIKDSYEAGVEYALKNLIK